MYSKITFALIVCATIFSSCKKDKSTNGNLALNIVGLEDLGSNFRYEGWLIVNGKPVTTGTFSVNASGVLSANSFTVNKNDLSSATKFVLTIEPYPDNDPAPTATHILAGDFNNSTASLTIGAPEALGNNFSTAKGSYVLATPSDGMNNNEKSGIWFLGSLPPTVGLTLPTLPAGWKYEGWAVINGVPVSTGTFLTASGADAFAGYSGTMGVPTFPGEDFIINAPTGVNFPTNLAGAVTAISIEPSPDNSSKPFVLKPLTATIPTNAADHVVYQLNNTAANNAPTGTVSR